MLYNGEIRKACGKTTGILELIVLCWALLPTPSGEEHLLAAPLQDGYSLAMGQTKTLACIV